MYERLLKKFFVIRTYKTVSCNPVDIGIEKAEEILRDSIYEICDGISFSSVCCFAGIAGRTSAYMQERLRNFLRNFVSVVF